LAATLLCLWRVLEKGRGRDAVFGGLALGLSQYTYVAARLLPVLLIALCLADPRRCVSRWRQLVLFGAVALLVFLPEGLYFVEHRDLVLLRASQVSVFNPNPLIEGAKNTPPESLLNTAGMFLVRGDPNPRNNIPNRPVFDPLLGILFVAGLGLAAKASIRSSQYRWPLIWLPVMLLPSALAHESPNMFRAIAAAPATFFFPALALHRAVTLIRQPHLRIATVAVVVLATGAMTGVMYFGRGPADAQSYRAFDAPLTRMAAFVNSRSEADMYVSLDRRAPVLFLAPRSEGAGWYREESAAIPIPSSAAADVLFVAGQDAQLGRLASAVLPGLELLEASRGPDGRPDFQAFHWNREALESYLAALRPAEGSMAPDFALHGLSANRAGDRAALTLAWRPLDPDGPYDLFVHLFDPAGQQVAQADTLAWPLDGQARNRGLLLTHHTFALPPGTYIAEIGAVHRSRSNRGQLEGGTIGDVVRIEVVL
jgi:hypothetical protein